MHAREKGVYLTYSSSSIRCALVGVLPRFTGHSFSSQQGFHSKLGLLVPIMLFSSNFFYKGSCFRFMLINLAVSLVKRSWTEKVGDTPNPTQTLEELMPYLLLNRVECFVSCVCRRDGPSASSSPLAYHRIST